MHSSDEDCATAGTTDKDGNCAECGVSGGAICPACGGERFHREFCPNDETEAPADRAAAAAHQLEAIRRRAKILVTAAEEMAAMAEGHPELKLDEDLAKWSEALAVIIRRHYSM